MVGRSWYDFILPSEAGRFRSLVEKCATSGAPLIRLEHTNLHRDGHQVVLETSAAPVLDARGKLQGYRGIDRDITEAKEAQQSLRERERRYRQLLAAIPGYAYSVKVENGSSVATTHGEACLAVTGYKPRDYAADPNLWISMVHPEDRDMVRRYVARVHAGEDVVPMEHRIFRSDRTTRWVRNTVIPHREHGKLVRYDGLIEDITERKRAERALRDRELQLLSAQKIQERLLPQVTPTLPNIDLAGKLCPAEFAAGDYFDYLTMRDSRLGIVIGDVTGHGFGPALIMAATHVVLRLLTQTQGDVAEILTVANSVLHREIEEDRFVTLLFACLDPEEKTLVYCNAGHPPGYVLDSSGRVRHRLEATDLPLGIDPDIEYSVGQPVQLQAGDTVLLFSDGVLDSISPQGEFFGARRALEVVRDNLAARAADIAARLCQATRAFSGEEAALDDTTAVVIKVQ